MSEPNSEEPPQAVEAQGGAPTPPENPEAEPDFMEAHGNPRLQDSFYGSDPGGGRTIELADINDRGRPGE